MPEEKNIISIDYLIDIIAFVRSVLNNIDKTSEHHDKILSEISENLFVLSELNKKQNQDQRMMILKYDDMVRSLDNLANEIKLSKQEIVSSNEKLQSNFELTSQFKQNNLNEIEKVLESLTTDLRYLRQEEETKILVKNIQAAKTEGKIKILDKIIEFIKSFVSGGGVVYKILLLIVIISLIVLWLTGIISWQEIKHIVGGLKSF